jgi:DNA-directed RNA polymerase subunit omega
MSTINDRKDVEDQLKSRYSIVIATSKRAREIIDGDEPLVDELYPRALSNAVWELYEGKIDIV